MGYTYARRKTTINPVRLNIQYKKTFLSDLISLVD